MKHLTITIMLLASPAMAQYTIQPQFHDVQPFDGLNDAGSYTNPYVIQDNMGRTQGTIWPRLDDVTPGDGLNDAGSWANPYELDLP